LKVTVPAAHAADQLTTTAPASDRSNSSVTGETASPASTTTTPTGRHQPRPAAASTTSATARAGAVKWSAWQPQLAETVADYDDSYDDAERLYGVDSAAAERRPSPAHNNATPADVGQSLHPLRTAVALSLPHSHTNLCTA